VISRRRSVRKWRLRGRRGQVSAVATILGLLLVVTFLANYLTTTLPQQMSINDLNHVVQVENQVGRLSALLEAASAADAVGAQFTQPITLGSAGTPPFASADPGTLRPATNGSLFNLNVPLGGAWSYSPPTVGTLGFSNPGGGCTQATDTVTCTGASTASTLYWNVSSGTPTAYTLSGTDGTYNLRASDSGTSTASPAVITLSLTGTGTMNILILGNNVSLPTTISDGGNVNYEVLGNNDNITITASAPGADVSVFEDGLSDSTWIPEAAGLDFLGNIAGTSDYVGVTTSTTYLNAQTLVSVFYLSDNPTAKYCPNSNGASSDYVAGGHAPTSVTHFGHTTTTYYGDYNVTYNVTTLPVTLTTPPPYAIWETTNNSVSPAAANCPFFVQAAIPIKLGGTGAGLQVHLANTYIAQSDVALDEGAVVYAQEGAVPVMVDPPDFSGTLLNGQLSTLSIWLPVFVGRIPVDYGLATSEFTMRLISTDTVSLAPLSGLNIAANANLNVSVVSPYAAAWFNFFNDTPPWEFFSEGCIGPAVACSGPYESNGPLGTAWMDIDTGTALSSVTIQIATFSVGVV